MIISGDQELINHLESTYPKRLFLDDKPYAQQKAIVKSKVFKNYTFTKNIHGVSFQHCKFVNCTFENIWGFYLIFGRCEFTNCEFKNSRFSHLEMHWNDLEFNTCVFRNFQIDEGSIFSINFNKCQFYNFTLIGMHPMENVFFMDCYIENSQFKHLCYYKESKKIKESFYIDLQFYNCHIEASFFTKVDFRNSLIYDTILLQVAFIDCKIMPNSIIRRRALKLDSYASIDFQSILKSEFGENILQEYFNINDPFVKDQINKVTRKMEYQRVFISFSFKDLKFAERLYVELTSSGVICFFWVNDAPPGKGLEDIMTSNIHANEKILFIASEASIRSQACQFELSQGRKKQEKTWEDVFFPIHIDNFLFEVEKNKIRPVDKAEEYWKNIEELRQINSADFRMFNKEEIDNKEFKKAVAKIVRELAIKP